MRIRSFVFNISAIFLLSSCGGDEPNTGIEELPKLSISSVTQFEGEDNTTFTFDVFLSKAYDKVVTVDYQTEDGTAGRGTDYVASMGQLTIPVGERSTQIRIDLITDNIKELDETFSVVLSNPTNATISTAEGIGTIRNEDTFVDIPEEGYITPESYAGYTLSWQDEFTGSEINSDYWTFEMGDNGWGNEELQYYTDRSENASLQDGSLIIEAREESFNGAEYTSARIITQDKKTFTHGRVDIRAVLPEGQGIWPALWMLGNNISSIGWPACGEIDIMELVGHEPSTVHGTAHWGPQGQSFSTFKGEEYRLSGGEKFSDKYHVFSIIWEPGKIEWYVNDNKYYSITTADVNVTYPFDNEFFFIFNIAVGGRWPGNPDATTQFPQRMIVDYIRVFDRD